MKDDCFIKNNASTLSDYELVEKDPVTLKKTKHSLKAALCKHCGYVELYVDLEK